ncbi:MAG: hypothetical protein ISEC1_P0765 [Thiomicrorhabdus sp.]|nr:MAG: hypothetical protein ISEC1_P0765 [Thiomicrorhabdus sp.]
MKKLLIATLLLFSLSATAGNSDTKQALADEYFSLINFKDTWKGMVTQISARLPENQRLQFVDIMNNRVDLNKITSGAKASLKKHLTEKELLAFVEFMRKPEGRSSLNKMRLYMADVVPIIQGEMKRIQEDLKKEVQARAK